MKRFVVIAYDISDDKKRLEISDLLITYGIRVNKSVFECFVSEAQLRVIRNSIEETGLDDDDSVIYYRLCRNCIEEIKRQGRLPAPKETVKTV